MTNINAITRDINLKSIYLGISENCNASCPFCYREFFSPKPKGFMSEKVFNSILKQVHQIDSIKNISLTVAEPTLHPLFEEFSIKLNSKKRYKTTVVTNMATAHKHLESLVLYDGIVMSIEGFDKESYESSRRGLKWERVRKNVILLDEYIRKNSLESPLIKINYIINRTSEIRKFVDAWSAYTDIIMIDPMLPQTKWNKGRKELVDTSTSHFSFRPSNEIVCTEPFYRLGVLSDGSIKPCGTRMYQQKDYGNYKDLRKVFNSNRNITLLRNSRIKNNMLGCKNCRHSLEVDKFEWQNIISDHVDLIKHKNVVFAKGLMAVNGGIWQTNKNQKMD